MDAIPQDTIAALATPIGRAGVGIIRVSGPQTRHIAQQILGKLPQARYAEYLPFKNKNGETLDIGIALFFSEPNSFTGEDVLELQGHGGTLVMDLLLQTVIDCGARMAKPGEFSERAFINDKMDLTQAEAIADLIDAGSRQAVQSALNSLQGKFATTINEMVMQVTQLRVYVEAAMDFPDEEIDFISEGRIAEKIEALNIHLNNILDAAEQGSLLREGIQLVLVGQPNAGKSSLLNALSGDDTAIVTEIPGTTRDVIRETIYLQGIPLHIIDTAGLRDSQDQVEQEGIRRTWQAIERAHVALIVIDDTQGLTESDQKIINQLPGHLILIKVFNKVDITGRYNDDDNLSVAVSAKFGTGLENLKTLLRDKLGYHTTSEGVFSARRRHLDALHEAAEHVSSAQTYLQSQQAEFVAEELRLVQEALGRITGLVSSDDLLGEIFSSFCIGK